MFKVISREELTKDSVYKIVVEASAIASKAKPGQFILLRVDENGEKIPLTISNSDKKLGTITLIFQVVGKTTMLMRDLKVGDSIRDIVGPLGKPTHIDKVGTVVCVGGGTGTAVLYPITKALKEIGNNVISILGSRSKALLILEREMRAASHDLKVCTDDGSYGHKGLVTEVLKEILESDKKPKLVVAIGPVPMMKFVSKLTKEYGVKTLVSLNPIMVDGTGMCGGCRVSVGGVTKFCCVDGPEFDGHKVDFDELMMRLSAYKEQEKCSADTCRMHQQANKLKGGR